MRLLLGTVVAALLAALTLAAPAGAATRVWAVGDGGVAGRGDDEMAAQVARWGIDRLLYLGDVYANGTREEFRDNYAPAWGRFKSITHPTPGNHEWSARREGYDPYWGRRAFNAQGEHYYSFDIGRWHLVSLNSHEDASARSTQLKWLRRDLARYGGSCTIAFWHIPRYSAGVYDDDVDYEPFWRALRGRAAVVLNGHEHNYQRLRRIRGITQFVVGTGGRTPLHPVDRSDSRLAVGNDSFLGALRLDLMRARLRYEYRTKRGRRLDSGRLRCRRHRPVVSIARPRGPGVKRGSRILSGRARGYAGRLRVSLVRRDGRGRSSRRSFSVRDRDHRGAWRLRLPARAALRPGRYVLTVRASDPAGGRDTAVSRFRVR